MKPVTEEWFNKAQDDLDVIKKIINDEHLTNMVAFHAQQVIEKSFKAIVEEFEIGFIRTHNLEKLYGDVKDKLDFHIALDTLKELDKVYIDSRYPSALGFLPYGKPTIDAAERFYDFASNIYGKTKGLLVLRSTNF
jgi:HEPN domain-containing protein